MLRGLRVAARGVFILTAVAVELAAVGARAEVTSVEIVDATGATATTLKVVGTSNMIGVDEPDPRGEFRVFLLGPQGGLPYIRVTVDLTACEDVCLFSGIYNWDDGTGTPRSMTQDTKHAYADTDMNGAAYFRLVGRGSSSASCVSGETGPSAFIQPGLPPQGAGPFRVAVFDRDGSGVSGADLSLWFADYGCSTYHPRADFDGNGVVGGADMSLFLNCWGAGSSSYNPSWPGCP